MILFRGQDGQREKAVEKIRRNPKNVRYEEIETILSQRGFVKRQEGTSHVVFVYGKYRITIPRRQPFIKAIYVKLVIEILDQLTHEDNDQD